MGSSRVGGDENIGALTDRERDGCNVVRLDGDEIVCNDGHGMSVDGEALDAVGAGVDEPQPVRLSGLELELGDTCVGRAGGLVACGGSGGAIKVHLAVDEVVVRGHAGRAAGGEHVLDQIKVRAVVPVGEHDGAEIDVVLGLGRAVDDNGADDAAGVLRRVVGVVPGCAVEACFELVGV